MNKLLLLCSLVSLSPLMASQEAPAPKIEQRAELSEEQIAVIQEMLQDYEQCRSMSGHFTQLADETKEKAWGRVHRMFATSAYGVLNIAALSLILNTRSPYIYYMVATVAVVLELRELYALTADLAALRRLNESKKVNEHQLELKTTQVREMLRYLSQDLKNFLKTKLPRELFI